MLSKINHSRRFKNRRFSLICRSYERKGGRSPKNQRQISRGKGSRDGRQERRGSVGEGYWLNYMVIFCAYMNM